MTTTAAPFGFRPAYDPTGSTRASAYTIATGYATALYKYAPVILNTDGTVTAGSTGASLLGVFAGCQYTDSTGKPTYSDFWPASTTATNITAWIWASATTVFEVQSSGSIAQTAIGDQADCVNPTTGSTSTGLSASSLNSTLAGASSQKQFRIIGFSGQPDNTPGDAYTIVQVQIAQQQYVADKVAI